MSNDQRPRRILLKLSGEALSGQGRQGLDADATAWTAAQIGEAAASTTQIAIVVGGGNIVRGGPLARKGLIGRYEADTIGMLGTAINAVALAEALSATGTPARAMTAIAIPDYIERYHPRAAGAHLDAGRTVVLGGGVGNPMFTTDTTACLRGAELGCAAVLKATKVDGVYDADPKTNPNAKRYTTIKAQDAIDQRLGVMDLTAMAMAIDNAIEIVVFDFSVEGNIAKAVKGENIGTRVEVG